MIVRRLCVTPAVASVMQWLFTRRNRTPERTCRGTVGQRHGITILKEETMSEESKTELQGKTERLLHGPLKHVRAAVLVAALVPLASVPATAQQFFQTPPASGGAPGISVSFTQGCTGYTLTFAGFGIGNTGSTAAVSYTIAVAPSSPPVTARVTSPITVTSADVSGDFASTVSGIFSPALVSGDTVLVTAMVAGVTGS